MWLGAWAGGAAGLAYGNMATTSCGSPETPVADSKSGDLLGDGKCDVLAGAVNDSTRGDVSGPSGQLGAGPCDFGSKLAPHKHRFKYFRCLLLAHLWAAFAPTMRMKLKAGQKPGDLPSAQ